MKKDKSENEKKIPAHSVATLGLLKALLNLYPENARVYVNSDSQIVVHQGDKEITKIELIGE